MNRWEQTSLGWKTMPPASSSLFFTGVFCLFASLVLIGSSMNPRSQSVGEMISDMLIGGLFAMLWARAGTRRLFWWFLVLGPLEAVFFSLQAALIGPHQILTGQDLGHKLQRNGYIEIALVVGAYIAFVSFFSREGARFFRTQTEVRLAGEIHRAMVPPKHQTIGNFELFGTAIPSSEVGGDLFDIVETGSTWHAYVADVSGHGVAAGILMSMIKSTASMQLTRLNKPQELLADINDVMLPLTSTANYLTFAYVSGSDAQQLNFALAGHLPILHYQAQTKTILEHSDTNVPLGLFKDQAFTVSQFSLSAGDLLAIVTDGFTEVFDSQENELGLEQLKSMLLDCAEKPLPEIHRDLRAAALAFGKQSDDQTMLLIRRHA
jgi:serine phosphatase RsbU (regulator of sigma subunit)